MNLEIVPILLPMKSKFDSTAGQNNDIKGQNNVGAIFFLFFFFLLTLCMSVVLLKTSKMPEGEHALVVRKALCGTENKWVENTKQNKRKKKTDTLACNYHRVPESH